MCTLVIIDFYSGRRVWAQYASPKHNSVLPLTWVLPPEGGMCCLWVQLYVPMICSRCFIIKWVKPVTFFSI
jgi:hypothetical protein